MLEALRGLMMTGGGTIRFVERAGWSNAMKYLLTGLEFDSKEALRLNLIQEIVEEEVLFTKAVEKRLMADVPFGVLLSGGLDSTTVLAISQKEFDVCYVHCTL